MRPDSRQRESMQSSAGRATGRESGLAYGERGAQLEQRNPVAELRRRRATQPCLILSYFIHVKSDRIRQVIACCAKLDVSAYHLFVCRIGCQSRSEEHTSELQSR